CSDRDTVVLGIGALEKASELSWQAEAGGRPVTLSWTVSPAQASDDHAYLSRLVNTAQADQGASLSIVGKAGLEYAKTRLDIASRNLSRLSAQALASKDTANAKRLAEGALALDPNNPEAQAVRRAVDPDSEEAKAARQAAQRKIKPIAFQQPAEPEAAPPA